MKTLIVIPARYPSTRFPGKPLVMLKGASGQSRSLVERSWRAAMAVPNATRVVVATDDDRIRDHAEAFGAEVVMTPDTCANGTERCAAVLDVIDEEFDIIANLQGDAPLTPAWAIEDIVTALSDDPDADMATPVLRCDGAALNGFLADRRAGRVGGTTAVFDGRGHALYFSKEVIPYTGKTYGDGDPTPVYHHVGAYAYRPDTLRAYAGWSSGPLEGLEGLEQLRFLENGRTIRCVEIEARGVKFWEINNPEDVPVVEAGLAALGIE